MRSTCGEPVVGDGREQPLDRGIDMGAKARDLRAVRARDQAAARARVTRSGRDVIRVEEMGETLIEDAVARQVRQQQKLLEEPGRVRAMPLGRAGIGHRLHLLVLGGKRRGAALGFRAHGEEGVAPDDASVIASAGYGGDPASSRRRRRAVRGGGGMPGPGLEQSDGDDGKQFRSGKGSVIIRS